MKNAIIVLTMLPLAAFAQKDTKPLKPVVVYYKNGLTTNYEHLRVNGKPSKSQSKVEGEGIFNFGRDDKNEARMKYYTAAQYPEYDYGKTIAQSVVISSPAYPDLKGDTFVYDNLTDKAVLSGHVSISDHGVDKQIGDIAYLDFTDNDYKIEGIR